jgi:hypothetical protein
MDIGELDEGRELVTRFSTDLNNLDSNSGTPVVYTDDSGLEYQRRITNLTYYADDPVAGNYYPISTSAFITDETKPAGERLTLITDRAHGAASLLKGQLEVMVQRRCLSDDGKGVGETLNETGAIDPRLGLILDSHDRSVQLSRRLAIERYLPAVPLIGGVESADQWRAAFGTTWGGGLLKEGVELPPQIHLLSLERTHGTEHGLIIRLQHLYEKGEHPSLAKPVTLNLLDIFSADLGIEAVTEMTLSALLPRSDAQAQRLKWKVEGERTATAPAHVMAKGGFVVTIAPREIRTFLVN